jgi:hypothetical protein
VPALGALTVWLTFLLGRHLAGPVAGLIAGATLLSSPPFLIQLVSPMSDVPVTAWWLLASVLAMRRTVPTLVASGAAAALAVVTRPNLAPLGLLVAVLAGAGTDTRDRLRALAAWAPTALVGPVATAVIHAHLYGSPFASGYGDLGVLYAGAHVWPNVQRYASWLWTNQTPFIAAGVCAVPLLLRRGRPDDARLAAWALCFALTVVCSYLWYLPFEEPTFLRFLLPAYPMLLTTAAATVVLIASTRPRVQPLAAAAIAAVIWTGWGQADPAFSAAREVERFRIAGEWTRTLPPDAIVISNMHSGSVRYYGDRLTLRSEWVSADQYDDMMAFLTQQHRPTYAVFDREELPHFTRWFAGSDLSWLRAEPVAVIDGRVYVYSVPLTPIVPHAAS